VIVMQCPTETETALMNSVTKSHCL